MDIAECCFEDALNPPDPEIAAGTDHLIAVVNSSLEIYEKDGTSVFGPMPLEIFFAGLGTSCDDRVFDPNSVYDEEAERFIVAADGSGAAYCVAVSATSDPLGEWHFYKFPTNIDGDFFDFPHAGVGRDAIYMAAKMIPGARAIMWAFDKAAMYEGLPTDFVTQEVGVGTLQPLHLHGARHGTWPDSGPHYLMLDGSTLGTFEMFAWDDPFGIDLVTSLGEIDVAGVHGAELYSTVGATQNGGNSIRAGDGRVLDFEYHDGSGWITNVAACRQGSTIVNCVQWAEIDLGTATVVQAGVFGSPTEHRTYADLAVDRCGGMAIGFSKFSIFTFPSTAVAGRDAGDPLGMLTGEVLLKEGEAVFFDTGANSWGDYTGMTIDPEGTTFWYLGEYSKEIPNQDRNWGTFVGSFALPACSQVFVDGFESGDTSSWGEVVGGR